MLITLNELGKFLYKTINEIVAKFNDLMSKFCHFKFLFKLPSKNNNEKLDPIKFAINDDDEHQSINNNNEKKISFKLQYDFY